MLGREKAPPFRPESGAETYLSYSGLLAEGFPSSARSNSGRWDWFPRRLFVARAHFVPCQFVSPYQTQAPFVQEAGARRAQAQGSGLVHASEGITDGANDKKIDFIYLDRDAKRVIFAQGFYRIPPRTLHQPTKRRSLTPLRLGSYRAI